MEESKKIVLDFPIPIKAENGNIVRTNELEFGRMKAKHLKLLPKGFVESGGKIDPQDIIPLIAGLADIPIESAEEIDIEDLNEVAEVLSDFLSQFQATGKKPSGV